MRGRFPSFSPLLSLLLLPLLFLSNNGSPTPLSLVLLQQKAHFFDSQSKKKKKKRGGGEGALIPQFFLSFFFYNFTAQNSSKFWNFTFYFFFPSLPPSPFLFPSIFLLFFQYFPMFLAAGASADASIKVLLISSLAWMTASSEPPSIKRYNFLSYYY